MGGVVAAVVGVLAVWTIGSPQAAIEEIVLRAAATLIIILSLTWVYWSKLISIPAMWHAEQAQRIEAYEADREVVVEILFNKEKNIRFEPNANVPVNGVMVKAPSYWFSVDVRARRPLRRARGVTVRIINVEHEKDGDFHATSFGGPLPLRWAYSGADFAPRDLDDLGFTVDVFSADQPLNAVFIKWPQPTYLRNANLFDLLGTYRITVDAQPHEGPRTTKQLTIIWRGQWDQVGFEGAETARLCLEANT
jgi:hypothetical protein